MGFQKETAPDYTSQRVVMSGGSWHMSLQDKGVRHSEEQVRGQSTGAGGPGHEGTRNRGHQRVLGVRVHK